MAQFVSMFLEDDDSGILGGVKVGGRSENGLSGDKCAPAPRPLDVVI